MTQPKARCVTCLEIIQTHDTHKHQRPKFCEKLQCRQEWKNKPICCRPGCRGPLTITWPAQRYHEGCNVGCEWCGKELFLRSGSQAKIRKNPLQDIYCSAECRDSAWEGQPMPICPECQQPTAFNEGKNAAMRNPPALHSKCNPQDKGNKKRRVAERMNEEDSFWYAFRKVTYRPTFHPARNFDERGGPYDPFSNLPPSQLADLYVATFADGVVPCRLPRAEEPDYGPYRADHPDLDITRGGWATEQDLENQYAWWKPIPPPIRSKPPLRNLDGRSTKYSWGGEYAHPFDPEVQRLQEELYGEE